jgi:hypothetical protein
MKRKILICSLIATLFSINSCQDALEEVPLDFTSPENFYTNAKEARFGAYSLYNTLVNQFSYNLSLWRVNDYATNALDGGNTNAAIQLDQFSYDANIADINYWGEAYRSILRANLILENVPEITMNEAEKNAILAEAHAIRAWHYFNLVRLFGDVPLRTEVQISRQEASSNPRVDKEVIYDLILEDLTFAENNLPLEYPPSEVGRATQGAAKTMLAVVHLTRGEFQQARDKAKEVMDLGVYELMADYRDVFDPDTKNNAEHILSAQFQKFRVGAWFESVLSPAGSVPCGFSQGTVNPEWYESFPDTYRKDISVMTEFVNDAGDTLQTYDRPYVKKYIAWSQLDRGGCFSGENNFPILRYAEVLLIFAEAENEVNGPTPAAYEAINAVRERARTRPDGTEDVEALPDLAGLNQSDFRNAVYQEREWELCFEAHGWFDLVRTGRLIEVNQAAGKTNVSETHLLYPIPQSALDLNTALTQNPGYN